MNEDAPTSDVSRAIEIPPPQGCILRLHIASAAAATTSALQGLGVTHIVNVTRNGPMPQHSSTDSRELPYEVFRVPVENDLKSPIHEHLDAAADFMSRALSGGGTLCVFCASGMSAAPTVVAFFLMRQYGLDLADALAAVRAACPLARPNVGFWQRLVEAESWLRDGLPSMSAQQYRWDYLEASCPGQTREEILQQLELAQAEALAIIHRHSYTPV